MKHFIYIIVTFAICLCSCKKSEPVIENRMLLRGAEGRLWLLNYSEGENSQYLWFDRQGHYKFLEFDWIETNTHTFIPDENHLLNGCWENVSDSLISMNGQPYRMIERKIRRDDWEIYWALSNRELILHNTETGDSIRLLDAYFPPYIEEYRNIQRENRIHYEQWGKNIKSSILLKGEKIKLYMCVFPDGRATFHYYDDNGICTVFNLTSERTFSNTYADDLDLATTWYQKGDTIVNGRSSKRKYTIKEISSSRDSIRIWDEEMGMEYLYIDTKLPPSRKKK